MQEIQDLGVFHNAADTSQVFGIGQSTDFKLAGVEMTFTYDFEDFFHPFVGQLIKQLNQTSVAGMLNPDFLLNVGKQTPPVDDFYTPSDPTTVNIDDGTIDVSFGGPYANYNWELLYHIPVMVAVHLSNNQRFAEAQKWFHLVFDPTNTDTTVPTPERFWRSFVFSGDAPIQNPNTLITLLSDTDPAQAKARADVIAGYNGILAHPFEPHVVARSRPSAYQWYVVMKYLD